MSTVQLHIRRTAKLFWYPSPRRADASRVPTMPPSKPLDALASAVLVLTICGSGIAGWYGIFRCIRWLISLV